MSNNRIKMPLSVYVLYHKDYKDGVEVYTEIYHLLCRDAEQPLTDGIDIPVFLRTGGNGETIPDIEFDQSTKTAIFLLVDETMYFCSLWKNYIEKLAGAVNNDVKIYPIALFKHAFDIDTTISKNQFIKLITYSIKENLEEFKTRIFDNLIRFIKNKEKEKLKLFISHSKNDNDNLGEIKAKELRDYLRADTKLDSFFDSNDIIDGYDFDAQIKNKVENSLLIILKSNSYSEREWCRIETLAGKKHQVPCIVVSLIDGIVKRNFPYMGNTPLIRFDNNWSEIINLLLRTALNQYYQKQLLTRIKEILNSDDYSVLPFAPELLSFCIIKDMKKVLYPEPPLGKEEIDFLKLYDDSLILRTPMQTFSDFSKSLKSKKIAISISDSDDIKLYGGTDVLIRDITIELSRHILISGGTLVYGGDLRKQGFTELFSELSCQYGQLEKSDRNIKYFTNYFAWPIYLNLDTSQRTEYEYSRVAIEKVDAPEECLPDNRKSFLAPTTLENKYLWAKSLTKMRYQMEKSVNARIILGGRTYDFKGKYAGIIEEFIISKELEHPIYLLGGFGGVSKIIVDILEKKITDKDYFFKQAQKDLSYSDFFEYYNLQSTNDKINYQTIFDNILKGGISGLNNGLSETDNKILFRTTNVLEIVAFVLKGLNNKLKIK
jgi:hypothetical protein